MNYGLGDKRTIGALTGPHPANPAVDDIDRLSGSIETQDGSGMQYGEHPAKAQPKVIHFIE